MKNPSNSTEICRQIPVRIPVRWRNSLEGDLAYYIQGYDSKSCKNCSKGKKCEEHSYKKQDTFSII